MLKNWSCIVITCPTISSVISTEQEVNYLKRKGRLADDLFVLTVEDPVRDIGSGAATLNALLVATEHLSAKQNFKVVSSDVLNEARILILHNGRSYLYSCTGKAFISLPLEYSSDSSRKICASGIISNLESILKLIDELAIDSPYGVWVCSTDMMILREQKNTTIDWQNISDVVMFCVPSDVKYATGHGVVAIDEQGYISDIYYCGAEDQIGSLTDSDEKVPLVSGIVFLTVSVAESLLSLHVQAPLDSCTYLGLDSGADPIQVSLFFDILVAMSSKISKESFIDGKCGKTYNLKAGMNHSCSKESILARSLVWNELSRYKMSPKLLSGCQHLYWSAFDSAKYHIENLFRIAKSSKIHSICETNNASVSSQSLIVNSLLKVTNVCEIASNSVVYDSKFDINTLEIGENSFICGIDINHLSELNIPSNFVAVGASTKNDKIILVFGANESLMDPVDISNGTFCDSRWKDFFQRLDISENDLWSANLEPKQRTLWNAKLFVPSLSLHETLQLFQTDSKNPDIVTVLRFKHSQRYSLHDVMNEIDYSKILAFRRSIYAKISARIIKKVLMNNEDFSLLPYFHAAYAENWHFNVMDVIDEVLSSYANSVIKTRALSNMADLLGLMAGPIGSLRSGPGSNPAWIDGFALLKTGKVVEGLQILKNERKKWLDRPDHLVRAARHYERAAQILIHISVNTVVQSFKLRSIPLIEYDTFVKVECPARIDLQGGWSDTPPICYELGGTVVNIAVNVLGYNNNMKPVGAKACRLKRPIIKLKLGLGDSSQEITIVHIRDILNYDQPNAQGALLKAALVCAKIVDVSSNVSLADQLLSKFQGGFFIQSWSLLPQGCGMGTSSILAGAIVSALWAASGKAFDKMTVVHAVLHVEQLLTTGGGWQDQVAGILGGIQKGYSEAVLPLTVKSERINVSTDTHKRLNAHLMLIYTGKVRLAKNLLQNVVRNWYAREDTVVTCFKNLILNANYMKKALENGDFPKIGHLMDEYWEQKKILAPGCEPAIVRTVMERLKPICHGQLLVGAGGGGFMCILTKEPFAEAAVKKVLTNIVGTEKMTLHPVEIDAEGLQGVLLSERFCQPIDIC